MNADDVFGSADDAALALRPPRQYNARPAVPALRAADVANPFTDRERVDQMFFVTLKNDTLQPKHQPGDIVLIDPAQTRVIDSLFLIRLIAHDCQSLRWLDPRPDNKVELFYSNPHYPRYVCDRDQFEVIGRAVMVYKSVRP